MMSIKPLGAAGGGADKYCSSLANEDYYTAGGEPPGQIVGGGRHLLGLTKEITPEALTALMHGRDPRDGSDLVQRAGEEHRGGWDLTFSAPKSVSVVWSQTTDPDVRATIQQAQQRATDTAMRHIEAELAVTRRGRDGCVHERPAGIMAATFEHGTSREQDPQLHTHSLLLNLAVREDGTIGTLDPQRVYAAQKSCGAIYRATLARELSRELGVSIEADGDSFRIAGTPEAVERAFSQRRQQIEAAMAEAGISDGTGKIAEKFALGTRAKKEARPRAELFQEWQERGEALGFGPDQAAALRNRQELTEREPIDRAAILSALTATEATFDKARAWQLVAEAAQTQGGNGDALREIRSTVGELMADQEIVQLPTLPGEEPVYTTRSMLALEREFVARSQRMSQNSRHDLEPQQIAAAIAAKEAEATKKIQADMLRKAEQIADPEQRAAAVAAAQEFQAHLTDEQRAAVEHVCTSGGLGIYQGSAGAGKSFSAESLKIAYEAAGYDLLGACTSKRAAQNLQDETGITSYTTAKLLSQLDAGKLALTEKSLIVVDEAGMGSVTDLARLAEHAESVGSKIVLTGEDKQLDAVTHGGALRHLSRDHIVGAARIETVVRQREEWARKAVIDLRDGNADRALAEYARRGLVNLQKGAEATRTELVRQWQEYQSEHPDKKSVILATRNDDVRAISAEVRAWLQEQGRVGRENVALRCLHGGKPVDFEYSIGDRIKFGRNDERLGNVGVINGTLATVESVRQVGDDVEFRVRTDEGQTVKFRASEYLDSFAEGEAAKRPAISHAYALTVFSSQGITVDGDVFVHGNGMDRSLAYVAASRAKDNARLFVDSQPLEQRAESKERANLIAELAKSYTRDRRKMMAVEYLDEHRARLAVAAHADLAREPQEPTVVMREYAEILHDETGNELPPDYQESFGDCAKYIEQTEAIQEQQREHHASRESEKCAEAECSR